MPNREALIKDCVKLSAALSMGPTPVQLEQAVNFLVATIPSALTELEQEIESLGSQLATATTTAEFAIRKLEAVEADCDRLADKSDYIAARDIKPTDSLVEWEGYHVVGFVGHPDRPGDGKIVLRDRYGDSCWTPVRADETVEIKARGCVEVGDV